MSVDTDRRRNQRFPLELPMQLKWRGSSGEKESKAEVGDISSSGIYFYLPESLEEQGKVEFYVRLQTPDGAGTGVYLHCLGSIVRVEPGGESAEQGNRVGVAVHIDQYRFLRPDEKLPSTPS